MTEFDKTLDKELNLNQTLKEHQLKVNKSLEMNYNQIEREIDEWIKESISVRLLNRRDLQSFYDNIDDMDNKLKSVEIDLEDLEDSLLARINSIQPDDFVNVKANLKDSALDIDASVVKAFKVPSAYKLYLDKILSFQLNLLNYCVMFDLFEEKQVISHFNGFKTIFLCERGDIISQLAKALFKSNGCIKLRSYYQIESLFNQTIPQETKNKLKFVFRVLKIPNELTNNFMEVRLSDYIKLHNCYSGLLKILFNDKMINLFFEMFSHLLKLAKVENVLSKIWKKMKEVEELIDSQTIFRQLCLIFKKLTFFINEYKQFVYYFVIEGAFEKLIKNAKKAESFNALFKVS